MKCPYRKIIKHQKMGVSSTATIDVEEFADCYKDECPYYSPEKSWSNFVVSEACGRTISNDYLREKWEEVKEMMKE